jgi:hypothetical protein
MIKRLEIYWPGYSRKVGLTGLAEGFMLVYDRVPDFAIMVKMYRYPLQKGREGRQSIN